MTTLREAAQQALEALELTSEKRDPMRVAAITALRAALAQPEQEPVPVAWRYKDTARICNNSDGRMIAPPGWVPLYTAPPQRNPLDDAMALLNAMAQAYENGYNAGVANERERIICLLEEMQRQVGDAHNYYGVVAMRIREST